MEGKQKATGIILRNRAQLGIFQDRLFRHQQKYGNDIHHKKVMNDYQSYYEPHNNIYDSAGQTGKNDRPDFTDLEYLSDQRIGIGRYFTSIFAGKTVRNGFDFYDWEGNLKKHPEIMKALYKAKFYTEQIQWVKQELIYGTSFLIKYWSTHDKFEQPPPKKPFIACKAFPPSLLMPSNIWESTQGFLSEDEEKWNFIGGKNRTVSIHKDRVEILNTRPNPYDWIGYSLWESIYLSACAYLNLIINGLKMVAKYSNVVVAYHMPVPNPSLKMYKAFQEIINEMKANFTFVMGKDEKLEFLDSKMGTGLMEFGEFLKEDMAAGTGLPLNQTYGRADGGGLQGAGALISKQGELETISNYQSDLADNYWGMLNRYWDLDEEFVKFRLDYQKSDRARYEEEQMQWQNELLKAQVGQIKMQSLLTAMQAQGLLPNMAVPDQSGGNIGNQTGGMQPANQTGTNQSGLAQISKANQDFINHNQKIIRDFKPPVIDVEFRKDIKKRRKKF